MEERFNSVMAYFKSIELPTSPIRMNECSVITDVRTFLNMHYKTVKNYMHSSPRVAEPYLCHMENLRKVLESEKPH